MKLTVKQTSPGVHLLTSASGTILGTFFNPNGPASKADVEQLQRLFKHQAEVDAIKADLLRKGNELQIL